MKLSIVGAAHEYHNGSSGTTHKPYLGEDRHGTAHELSVHAGVVEAGVAIKRGDRGNLDEKKGATNTQTATIQKTRGGLRSRQMISG